MKRTDVYQRIDHIRAEQDAKWSDRAQYTRSAAHILVLDTQMQKLHAEWYASKPAEIVKRFTSIAATAVRALEELNPEEYSQD